MHFFKLEIVLLVITCVLVHEALCVDSNELSPKEFKSLTPTYAIGRYFGDMLSRTVDSIHESMSDWSEGRTFGAVKRLQMGFLAIFYKLGIMGTMLAFLTLISMKGLFIGVAILILNLSALLAKAHSPAKDWQPPVSGPTQVKNVHYHFHGSGSSHGHYASAAPHYSYSPYDAYEKSSQLDRLSAYSDLINELRTENNDRGYLGKVMDRLTL